MKRCISLLLAALLSFAGVSAGAEEPVLSMPEAGAESGLNETEDCPAAESDSLSAMSDAPGGYEDPAMEPSGTGGEAEPANAHADDPENADVSGADPAEEPIVPPTSAEDANTADTSPEPTDSGETAEGAADEALSPAEDDTDEVDPFPTTEKSEGEIPAEATPDITSEEATSSDKADATDENQLQPAESETPAPAEDANNTEDSPIEGTTAEAAARDLPDEAEAPRAAGPDEPPPAEATGEEDLPPEADIPEDEDVQVPEENALPEQEALDNGPEPAAEDAPSEAEELVAVFDSETELSIPETDGPDSEALLRAYLEKLLREAQARPGMLRSIRVDGRLDETCLALYQKLKPQIEAIAAGSQSSTELSIRYEDLGLPTRFTAEELGVTIKTRDDVYAGAALISDQLRINYALVQLALLVNCPYELYWYDKSAGARTTATPGMTCKRINGEYVYEVTTDYSVRMAVSGDYSADAYKVDAAVGQRVNRSVQTAKQIVEKYKGLNDLEKLEAYRDEICRLVSYNGGAAGGGQAYGDPWQLIYVFDEDSGTDVVCEGYAKAFQYLCDMTEFDGDVNCYTVTGRMDWGTGEGTHMWNIVTMSDGSNYLVDLTNSDSDTIGSDGSLFLTGEAEEDGDGLVFRNGQGQAIRYQYGSDTVTLYTAQELALSGKRYTVTCHLDLYPRHTLAEQPAIVPTCTEAGRRGCWYCLQDGRRFTDARGTAELTENELELPALGHAYGEWTLTVPPTCEADGTETRICAHDAAHTESRAVKKLGHHPVYVQKKAATYAAEGHRAYWRCPDCGAIFADAGGMRPLTAEALRLPRLTRAVHTTVSFAPKPVQAVPAEGLNALDGWRIARIEELLTAPELSAFNALSLYGQLAVVTGILAGKDILPENSAASGLAQDLLALPDRTAAFRETYPVSARLFPATGSAPVYEITLVRNGAPAETRLLLTAVGEGARMLVFTAD